MSRNPVLALRRRARWSGTGRALLHVVCAGFALAFAPGVLAGQQSLPVVEPNDNRAPAGRLADGLLSLELDAVEAFWVADAGPGERMYAFAEPGGPPRIPGPLVRTPTATRVRAVVRNTLADTLRVHGLHARPAANAAPVLVAPGDSAIVVFEAGEPGTYYYWGATSDHAIDERYGPETQLAGAFVVDSSDAPAADRVFVITSWAEAPDTTGPEPHVPRDMFAINGLSWPHTERFEHTVGDTVLWRWISPAVDAHPMHLHGFYFDMLSRGSALADTAFGPGLERSAVTETMMPGGTMTLRFVAERAGSWLCHCHFSFHVSHWLSFRKIPDMEDELVAPHLDHSAHGMAGLILALTVHPRPGAEVVTAPRDGRRIRLHVNRTRDDAAATRRLGYVVESDGRVRADSVPLSPQPLVLRRGEPVRISILNHLDVPTAVHWHGVEVEDSYADGVPGFSGTPSSVTPLIAPGDSFVAAFTPPRAGTFMLHSHANEGPQIASGLAAPLIVVDDPGEWDPSRELVVLIGASGLGTGDIAINGSDSPAPVTLRRGSVTRVRLITIDPDRRFVVSLLAGTDTATWRPIAKDGADLRAAQAIEGPARVLVGPGEIWDVEVVPASDDMRLVVVGQVEDVAVELPIRLR